MSQLSISTSPLAEVRKEEARAGEARQVSERVEGIVARIVRHEQTRVRSGALDRHEAAWAAAMGHIYALADRLQLVAARMRWR